jgi:hypothetical protein
MAEFIWHKMSEESPYVGKGHYILLGSRGAMYYANEFNEHGIFYVPNTRDGSKSVKSVVAWAEIPPLEDE